MHSIDPMSELWSGHSERCTTRTTEPRRRPARAPTARQPGEQLGIRHRVGLIDGFVCAAGSTTLSLPHGTQRLVALLGLAGRPLSRLDLGRTLWPDVSQDQALAALRTTVWRLNRLCPGMLLSRGRDRESGDRESGDRASGGDHLLDLNADVDIRELLQAADAVLDGSDTTAASPARIDPVQVFRSCLDLLPGWYDDWVLFHRERLLAVRVEVLRVVAARLLNAGRLTEALDLALAALSSEPLDEQTHMLVASIHLRQGNVSEALRQYGLCADLFASELGVPPSDRFRSLLPVGRTALRTALRGSERVR